jgi:hypothetical protein
MTAIAPTTVRRFVVRQAHHEAVNVSECSYHTRAKASGRELCATTSSWSA